MGSKHENSGKVALNRLKDLEVQEQKGSKLQLMLKEYVKELKKEAKNQEVQDTKVPYLTISDNKIRLNSKQVLKAEPRLIKIARRVIQEDPDKSTDPVYVIEQVGGKLDPSVKQSIDNNLSKLLLGTYKVKNRVSRSVVYRDFTIIYSPIETEEVIPGILKLTNDWGIKASEKFIKKMSIEVDARKYMKQGYNVRDKEQIDEFLSRINDVKSDQEDADDIVKTIVVEMANTFRIIVPLSLEVITIVYQQSDLETIVFSNQYIELKRLLNAPGISEFPIDLENIKEKLEFLETKIGDKEFFTDILPLVYFESFDYQPPSLDEKIASEAIWAGVLDKLRLTRGKYVTPSGVMKAKGKTIELNVFDINVPVTDKLSRIVVEYLDTLFNADVDVVDLEAAFRNAFPTIREYILAIASITSKIPKPTKEESESKKREKKESESSATLDNNDLKKKDEKGRGYLEDVELAEKMNEIEQRRQGVWDKFSLKSRIENGNINIKNLPGFSNDLNTLLPEITANKELMNSPKEMSRLQRFLTDATYEEANFLLQVWQPSVKRVWFQISIAPNAFELDKWIVDPTGNSCGRKKIYVMTEDGVQCLKQEDIKKRLDYYLEYNRKDLSTLL